jgi:hypothetical protein
LHTVLSGHGVPFVTDAVAHPVVGLQLSVVQAFPSLQTSAVPGVQVPDWQVSAPLQTLPSEHEVPSVTGVFSQRLVPVLHTSVVHGFESAHSGSLVQVVCARAVPAPTNARTKSHVPSARRQRSGRIEACADVMDPSPLWALGGVGAFEGGC